MKHSMPKQKEKKKEKNTYKKNTRFLFYEGYVFTLLFFLPKNPIFFVIREHDQKMIITHNLSSENRKLALLCMSWQPWNSRIHFVFTCKVCVVMKCKYHFLPTFFLLTITWVSHTKQSSFHSKPCQSISCIQANFISSMPFAKHQLHSLESLPLAALPYRTPPLL